MAKSFLDDNGLLYLWGKIKNLVTGAVSTKQDTISDLSTIRSGATKGATSVQKVKMNGTEKSPNSSGVADLGTVITAHQDISGKAEKSEMSVDVNGDTTTITLKSGVSADVINQHQDISGKADKSATVSGITYDTTNKKLKKTINGSTTDVVTASTIVTDGGGIKSHQTVTDNNPTLSWGNKSKVATIGSTEINVTMPSNPNTDTKVTSVGNHYAPEADGEAELSADASGATAAWNIDVVKGVKLQRDAKGHVTGVTVTSGKIPSNPNTNTVPAAYCDTAAGTAAKTAVCTDYALLSKSYVHVLIKTANSNVSALTLNINGKGAKPIYINGSASSSSNYTLPAGTYLVYYDGTNYYFRTDGKLTSNGTVVLTSHQDISGKADKTATVSNVAYDSTNKKITKTINGNTTDVVTVSTLKTALNLAKGDVGLGNVTNDSQVKRSEMGAANGVATLDANGKVPSSQLPSYVDDVIEAYARSGQTALSQNWLATGSATGTVITPEAGKIYVLMADTTDYAANTQFRWSGTAYVKLNDGGVSAITNAEIDTIVAS